MSEGYKQHGARHRPKGSDPVYANEPVMFDTDNEGGWLYIVANDSTDISYGDHAVAVVDLTGQGIFLLSSLGSDQSSIDILPTEILFSTSGTFSIGGTAGTVVRLTAGTSFQVLDHLAAPIFRVDEDGTVHIRTGGSILADL